MLQNGGIQYTTPTIFNGRPLDLNTLPPIKLNENNIINNNSKQVDKINGVPSSVSSPSIVGSSISEQLILPDPTVESKIKPLPSLIDNDAADVDIPEQVGGILIDDSKKQKSTHEVRQPVKSPQPVRSGHTTSTVSLNDLPMLKVVTTPLVTTPLTTSTVPTSIV